MKRILQTPGGRLRPAKKAVAPGEIIPWADLEWAADHLPLEEFLSFRLTRLASGVQAELSRHYGENYELSVPEWRTLAALARYGPINFGQLLALSTYDKSLISRAVTGLKNKRLASSTIDPEHGRRVIVNITAAGRAVFGKILPQARDVGRLAFAFLRQGACGIVQGLEETPDPARPGPAAAPIAT